jgi:hypothetical protein
MCDLPNPVPAYLKDLNEEVKAGQAWIRLAATGGTDILQDFVACLKTSEAKDIRGLGDDALISLRNLAVLGYAISVKAIHDQVPKREGTKGKETARAESKKGNKKGAGTSKAGKKKGKA